MHFKLQSQFYQVVSRTKWLLGLFLKVAKVSCVISPSRLIVGVVGGWVYFSFTSTKDVDHVLLGEITAAKMHAV